MSKKIKKLKFVCPECGSNRLGQVQAVPTIYPVSVIDPDGDFDYNLQDAKDVGGDVETLSHECMDCSFIIANGHGPIIDTKKVADWIKKNCIEKV